MLINREAAISYGRVLHMRAAPSAKLHRKGVPLVIGVTNALMVDPRV